MALQRALRRVFALILAAGTVTSASGTTRETSARHEAVETAPASDLFDEIFRSAAPAAKTLQAVSANFVETSTSTLLKAPQVARGTLVARRPSQVRLVYQGADARTVVISGNTLALDWPSRSLKETRDISGTMRRAERFFVLTSASELRKHFTVEAIDATDRHGTWRVTFTPKRAQMREGVSRVQLWIDKDSQVLQALRMEYPGGDTRLMEFTDVRINPAVDAEAFSTAARR